jgi:hypothetical protein
MAFGEPGVRATQILPESHREFGSLDLARNTRVALILNLAALPMFLVFGWSFMIVAQLLRPDIVSRFHYLNLSLSPVNSFLLFVGVILGMMIIHEAVHGLFFWHFTRSRPVFGLKLLFAYAGAPGWYIPRNQYIVVGLAPLILMTTAGFFLIALMTLPLAQLFLFGITMNASGAVGDLYVSAWVLLRSPEALIEDTGVGFTIFERKEYFRDVAVLVQSQQGMEHEQRNAG